MRVIGIDPGKSGAIAMVERNPTKGEDRVIWAVDCPVIKSKGKTLYDERSMANLLKIGRGSVQPFEKVYLEKVHAMPGQGVTSMFEFGKGLGIWLGILSCMHKPYQLVTPQRWKRDMLKDVEGTDQKARAVIAAKRMFHDLELPYKKDHGKADAIMIAAWGLGL